MDESICDLTARHCTPCEGGTPPLTKDAAQRLLETLIGWEERGGGIEKNYKFKDFYQTMAFVNDVAWISHREGHHPVMEVSYLSCRVRYSTRAVGGLSENDFICAAMADALIAAP